MRGIRDEDSSYIRFIATAKKEERFDSEQLSNRMRVSQLAERRTRRGAGPCSRCIRRDVCAAPRVIHKPRIV
ncbi:hypothetical protein EVAR_17295_1 [Eumeta japonica]|uniref:Uncharacterized protein n=1 Tax=Eumeta variegata TaxID=151549 RepID=A0A4C1TTE7_EUMVA|nr:hypothetical protein EVAR_17295_1 [Eumeta japonica]